MDFIPRPFTVFRPDVPFKNRWELLKPYLHHYFFDEKLKLSKIVTTMKEQYGFDANQAQYKYQFNSWGWKKSIPASKKEQMCDIEHTRAALGKSTIIRYKGQEVNPNKLRRYAKMASRKGVGLTPRMSSGRSLNEGPFNSQHPLGNTIFLRWNIPYKAVGPSRPLAIDRPSPVKSDISVATPPGSFAVSPKAASSLTKALNAKVAIDRAHVFLEGRINDLVKSMNSREKETTFTWLNQFWLFGFQTAKNWGRGPRDWTATELGFSQYQESASLSLPNTPRINAESPRELIHGEKYGKLESQPSQLCRWSIHVEDEEYEEVLSPQFEHGFGGVQDDNTWKEWPQSWLNQPFEEKIISALQSNTFSSLTVDELPFSAAQVASAARKSPGEVLVEAVGFSIIARNSELVEKLVKKASSLRADLSLLYPFHLAVSYLDGSKTCCNILDDLHRLLPSEKQPWKSPFNALGHTVLDNLMIAILKSHTSTTPGLVDHAFGTESRFVGEEVDICGRWDPDSECYRDLLASGRSSIPFEWKHKFCHTSAQAICHCLDSILAYGSGEKILETPSGLFLRHCPNCGRKLQLLPLHTLVLTAFQLAHSGCQGEDLFGVLACLLCLLGHGIDPCATAHISIAGLLGIESNERCPHEEVSPIDLAEQVPEAITSTWRLPARIGWYLFCLVLRRSHHERKLHMEDDDFLDISWHCTDEVDHHFSSTCGETHGDFELPSCFGMSIHLGHIWASVQAELLSYRRLTETDSWISKYFDMEELLESLEVGDSVSIGYVKGGMLEPYCRCGKFFWETAVREQTAKYYFANLDDYTRLTAIPLPQRQARC